MLHQIHGHTKYTYLEMKMPGPCGVITGTASFKVAYAYKRTSSERIPTLVGSQRAVTPSATDTIVVGLDTTVPMEQGGGPKTTPSTINVPKCTRENWLGGTNTKHGSFPALESRKKLPRLGKA